MNSIDGFSFFFLSSIAIRLEKEWEREGDMTFACSSKTELLLHFLAVGCVLKKINHDTKVLFITHFGEYCFHRSTLILRVFYMTYYLSSNKKHTNFDERELQ